MGRPAPPLIQPRPQTPKPQRRHCFSVRGGRVGSVRGVRERPDRVQAEADPGGRLSHDHHHLQRVRGRAGRHPSPAVSSGHARGDTSPGQRQAVSYSGNN